MNQRLAIGLLAAWLVTLCAATWSVDSPLFGSRIVGPQGQAPRPEPKKFSHTQHVQSRWLDRGHQRGVSRLPRMPPLQARTKPVSSPQAECDKCHTGAGRLQRKFGEWQQDLSGYRTRTGPAFRHYSHAMLECRECHEPKAGFVFDDFDIFTGPGQCARCHQQDRAADAAKSMRFFAGASASDDVARAVGLPGKYIVPPQRGADRAVGSLVRWRNRRHEHHAATGWWRL